MTRSAVIALGLTLLVQGFNPVQSEEAKLPFVVHELNSHSTYSACAVDDIDGDGDLDIICGGWWYEAPEWKKHFVREVRQIRGRYDGYSHLPYDVDGDGDTDFINVNYRSGSIFWIEHPGDLSQTWSKHMIDLPGAMESGRLFDIDEDGHLDLLPNGVKFAGWWQFDPASRRFDQRDLPAEVASHGVGYGDVNGDGRGDVVGRYGWLEAPEDSVYGEWKWHPEFELERDACIPIEVRDVDGDGDLDLVWARGHNYGIYWEEQGEGSGGARVWTRHLIDDSWSQCHSPLWADLDGDGREEYIGGKRYLAHDGRDEGAFDPLVVYSYEFDPESREWVRREIANGDQVGFGLDPKVVDLDNDGDLDLICPGRSGLYWLENRVK